MKFVIVFSVLVAAVFGAITPPSDYADKDHPGKCVYEGTPFDVGVFENVDSKSCYRFECLNGEGKGTIEFCGKTGYPPNCKTEEDLSKPYPDCCKKKATCT